MNFILYLAILSASGLSSVAVVHNSKEACEQAAAAIREKVTRANIVLLHCAAK